MKRDPTGMFLSELACSGSVGMTARVGGALAYAIQCVELLVGRRQRYMHGSKGETRLL